MTRLIDADYLIDDIEHCLWDWESVDGITASTVLKQTITDIKNQPTIDAVPVVRCKDCKHKTDCFSEVAMTTKHQTTTIYEPIEWCSKGERKES